MASIEKNLNTSVPAGVTGLSRTGVKPWSLSNMDDSNHKTLGTPGVASPSSGLKQVTDRLGVVTDQACITTIPGNPAGAILTDATQHSVTTSSHPNNGPGGLKDGTTPSYADNALDGPVNTRLDVNGPANTGQGADNTTYGPINPAAPTADPGYSILGE